METQAQCQANQEHLERLYESLKPIIWVVKITDVFKGRPMTKVLTAFAISKEGHLMTSGRGGWNKWSSKKKIIAKRLVQADSFKHEVVSVDFNLDYSVALLRVSVGSHGIEFGNFGSGNLNVADTVMTVGHPNDLVGSGLIGRVVYPCIVDEENFMYSNTLRCETYKSQSLEFTPAYRIAGHVWNAENFKQDKYVEDREQDKYVEDRKFEKNLCANVPIIQCSGLVGGEGTSGAPMINTHGDIIGMYYSEVNGYNIGLHVRALKEFLKESDKTGTSCSKKEDEASFTISKKMKI